MPQTDVAPKLGHHVDGKGLRDGHMTSPGLHPWTSVHDARPQVNIRRETRARTKKMKISLHVTSMGSEEVDLSGRAYEEVWESLLSALLLL